jgi:nucleoside-diphosphate-sugar epimerase
MARYVVTGAAGFIGSHLVSTLLDDGGAVVGVDAFTDYYARELKEENLSAARGRGGFDFVERDLAEATLEDVVDGAEGIFHLAAQPGVRGSWGESFARYAHDNVVATQRVLETASKAGVRVVVVSSSSIYGNAEAYPTSEEVRPRPISPYGVTKLCCETLARAYAESAALDHVVLRYFTVYGPRQRPDMAYTRIVRALADGATFTVFGTGEQSRDVTYVGDAVAATVAAMTRGVGGATYNVGGGSETSLREAIAVCERLSGARLDVVYAGVAAGDVRRTAADTSRARRDLAWEPRTSVEEGLRAQLEWAGVPLAA